MINKTKPLAMLKRNILLFSGLFISLCALLTACSSNEDNTNTAYAYDKVTPSVKTTSTKENPSQNFRIFSSIEPTEAKKLLQSREDILFLDVRTLRERAQIYIPGSQYISIGSVFKGTIDLPKDKAILLVCAVGGRSYTAGKIISARGQREVYNLSGGVQAWYKAGYPVSSEKSN